MAKKVTNEQDLRRFTKETSAVVEDALRSLASNVGDIFKSALQESQDVSKVLVKDTQAGLNNLAKVSGVLATNMEKAATGSLKQRDVLKTIQDRQAKIATIEAQIEIIGNNSTKQKQALEKELRKIVESEAEVNKQLQEQLKYSTAIQKNMGLTGVVFGGLEKVSRKLGLSGLDTVFASAKDSAQAKAKALVDSGKAAGSLSSKIKTLGAGLKGMAAGLKEMFSPEILIGGLMAGIGKLFSFITKKYGEGKSAAERISEENTNVARTLGLAQGAASKLAGSVAGIGPTVAASKQSVTQLYEAMGSTEKLTSNTLKVFVKLNTFAGMSAESLAKFQKFAKLSGEDAGTLVSNMAQTALETIKTNKFAFSQKNLLNDVANVSSVIRLRFRDQPKALVESVAKAKSLGIEMNKIEDIASSLLNFEDSIAAEMEAELLTGKQLNLEKAREAALRGDTAALQDEIISQLGSIEEFNKMNVIQQDAFAKSIGLSRGELAGMLDAQQSNLNTQGDLVEGQQDGMKAMMSSVSEAEKNAEIDRRRQEASLKYYTELSPLVQTLSNTWTKIQETLNGLFTDLVLKPMVEWVNGPAGKEFIASLPEKAEKFADAIKTAARQVKEVFGQVVGFIKEHPWLSAAIVGGAIAIKGTIFKKRDGSSASSALFVKLAGVGSDSVGDNITNMFKPKTKTSTGPVFDEKAGRYRDPSTGKFTKAPSPSASPSGGGNFFTRIGNRIADSNLGKFVSKTTSKAINLANKAVKFANPMTYIKEYMPKLMKSKGFKKTISAIPKIGKIASLAMIAYDLISQGAGISAAAKQGVGPQDIGKQIVMALGDLGGSIIGGLLGSLIPVPGVGTMLGTFLGGLGGSALAGLIADNTDVSGIGNWAINALGGPKDGGSAEDFILQDGKMTKFRKDDVIIGGTNLGGGDNGKTIQLLERLIVAVEKGGTVILDGQKVGNVLAAGSYRMQ